VAGSLISRVVLYGGHTGFLDEVMHIEGSCISTVSVIPARYWTLIASDRECLVAHKLLLGVEYSEAS